MPETWSDVERLSLSLGRVARSRRIPGHRDRERERERTGSQEEERPGRAPGHMDRERERENGQPGG